MNRKKILVLFIASILFISSVNYLFSSLTTEDLKFLILPTGKIVGLFSGYEMSWVLNEGLVFENLPIRIEKSCSGFIYFNMILLLLAIVVILKWTFYKSKIHLVLLAPFVAYLFAIANNSLRIITAIGLEKIAIKYAWFPNNLLHEVTGGFYFVTGLFVIYALFNKILLKNIKNGIA